MGADELAIRSLINRVAAISDGDGGWSVDVCQTMDGKWLVTDMAIDFQSYHWDDCPNKPVVVDRYGEMCKKNAVASLAAVLELDDVLCKEKLLAGIEHLRKQPEPAPASDCHACGMGQYNRKGWIKP
jgi:hypothetical protein